MENGTDAVTRAVIRADRFAEKMAQMQKNCADADTVAVDFAEGCAEEMSDKLPFVEC